jgi:hypothetical protein
MLNNYTANINSIMYGMTTTGKWICFLHNKLINLREEGVRRRSYKEKLDAVFENFDGNQKPNIETELLNSALFFMLTMYIMA